MAINEPAADPTNNAVIIHLHRAAPPKPAPGAPCNGCGVCCSIEPCPLGTLRHLQRKGKCPSLAWDDTAQRYRCGLLEGPSAWRRRLVARWIAAGQGCDCQWSE